MHAWGRVRGVNLGGLLDSREGVWPGWELKPQHLDAIVAAGFTAVRLPVRWWDQTAREFEATVAATVEQALGRGLSVVLSMHHADGLMKGEAGAPEQLARIWKRVTRQFANVEPELLAFDLLNEPRDALSPREWNRLLPTALAAVRTVDASRPVLVSGARMGSVAGLLELELPQDPHLAVTLHYYEPFRFTHQSAHWAAGSQAWAGTRWFGGDVGRGIGWPGGSQRAQGERDRRAVSIDLARAAAWAQARELPLVVGEFGVYERAPWADRLAWTAWVRSECERLGLGWLHWDFAGDFGIFDLEAQTWRKELLGALIDRV